MKENQENNSPAGVGGSIRMNRLRAGMTQVQLAKAISRSGKFLSEVETGKARLTPSDLDKLADALGISKEAMFAPSEDRQYRLRGVGLEPPRRIREVQPSGWSIQSFSQLVHHLDHSGWLRGANLWMIGTATFPEERDVALVEQLASLVGEKATSLRYVFPAERLGETGRDALAAIQGTVDALPTPLLQALRWSRTLRQGIESGGDQVIGYAVVDPLPTLCTAHTLLWVETEDVSWADVMPLLYCRSVTRTFEKPNESTAFWHHLPRSDGSKLLLEIANQLGSLQAHGPTT